MEAGINNKKTGRWIVDTGAMVNSIFYPAAKELGVFGRSWIGGKTNIQGISGETKVGMVSIKEFRLAGVTIRNPYFVIPRKKVAGVMDSKKYMGLIGTGILKLFVIYLDYDHQKIIFETK